jgi:hypothetical protein
MKDPRSGRNKGIIMILAERGLSTADGKRLTGGSKYLLDCAHCKEGLTKDSDSNDCCVRRLLATQPDFLKLRQIGCRKWWMTGIEEMGFMMCSYFSPNSIVS